LLGWYARGDAQTAHGLERQMSGIVTNDTQETRDALNCEADMMTALSRLFGAAYRKGRRDERKTHAATERQGQNERVSDDAPTQHGFGEGLVERLAVAIRNAYSGGWEFDPEHVRNAARKDALTILSEFAKMPCELPGIGDVLAEWERFEGITVGLRARTVLDMVRARLAPVLAAKDAEIEKWRGRAFEDQQTSSVQAVECAALRKELAELKSRTPANSCTGAERQQYETTIEQQRKRIEEQGGAIAELLTHKDAMRSRMAELEVTARMSTEQEFLREKHVAELEKQADATSAYMAECRGLLKERAARIEDLERRLAEATAVPTVDGKTPGQLLVTRMDGESFWDRLTPEEQAITERAALAVLRAFGQNAAEALGRVRVRLAEASFAGEITLGDMYRTVDDELAKLGGTKTPNINSIVGKRAIELFVGTDKYTITLEEHDSATVSAARAENPFIQGYVDDIDAAAFWGKCVVAAVKRAAP
jgi:hypothetical protein